ncbi:unnamed protein product [Laminaria digitata]
MIKVSGAPGVELVLEEEGSFALEDPPVYLLFPTPRLLVGVTAAGAVLAWDLVEGRRCGHLSSLLESARFSDSVTSVHSPDRSPGCGAPEAPAGAGTGAGAASDAGEERYIFLGLESGRVRVVQVLPVLRASGYVVEPRSMSSGAPEELLGSNGSGGVLGAVTSITSFRDRDGGGLALFGFRHGGIVLWDWVRRKRLAIRGLTRGGEQREGREEEEEEEEEGEEGGDGSGEVTSLAFHPTGEVFAAGFSSGCYAVFPVSSSGDLGPPRWVSEVGDDGLCPREGPTIVRTAVSLVRWVSVRGGAARAWGLLVAGGVEIDEGEEPDGVSLLVPPCAPEGGTAVTPLGGGRTKKKEVVAAALAPLETAVFVPFAIGQERLSSVHCATSGGADRGKSSSSWFKDAPEGGEGEGGERGETAGEGAYASDELVVLGLVTWNEEVRGEDGRLQFRRASSVQACPIQTSPYVALLQLAPEKMGPHLSGFSPVTAVASTPLLSSATILDFMTCVAGRGGASSPSSSLSLLRGGGLTWPDSVDPRARDEALCTSEMLVVGHSDGCLSFWECCGPASRHGGVSISEGRVAMREVPSGASLLGSLPAAELAGAEGEDAMVTALDVWIERDHVAAAERNACWVAVGFGNGNVIVLVLSSRMEVDVNTDVSGAEVVDSGGGTTPLAAKPVTVSNVLLGDDAAKDASASGGGGGGGGGGWKRLIGRGGRRASSADNDEEEDDEISAAIAAAQAEARRIEALEDSGDGREDDTAVASPRVSDDGMKQAPVGEGEGGKEGDQGTGDQETKNLRQELSEAMDEECAWGDSSAPPVASKLPMDPPKEDGGKQQRQKKTRRKASLVQLALHLHGHPVRCVTLSYDAPASSLALVVADAEGVVSVTDVPTGSASLLPIRVPQSRPCYPSLAIGPLPSALCKPRGKQEQEYGAAGALFVFLGGWLNVFDLSSRDPIDVVEVPGLAADGGSGGGDDGHTSASARPGGRVQHEESAEAWLSCIDECGVPLTPYASEPLSSFSPLDATARQDSQLGEGGGGGVGHHGREGSRPRAAARAQTIWVSPSASRTALESHHGYELQIMSGAPPPRPLLLVVRGAVAAVLAITDKDSANDNPLSRRRPASPAVAPFRVRSGAALVVKSRVTLPPAEGRGLPPRVDRAGVCMLAAGKAARRGCLVCSDTSGFVTGMLLPSLSPVFRDRLPASSSSGSGLSGGAMALAQKSVCNLVGELTIQGGAGELTRWSVLTDEACDALMESKPRLVKISALVRPTAGTQQLLASSQTSVGSSGGEASTPPKGRTPRGMLRRISLGGSKKSLAEVFAVDPAPQPVARRQSTAVDPSPQAVNRRQSTGGGGLPSASSTPSAPGRRGSGGRGDAQGQEQHQREALFGEREASGGDGGGGATATDRAGGGVSGAHAAVSEARDLAIERGEKLENMVDKSRQLEDSAMAFGDMAKELRKQQEDEACCVS